MILHRRILGHVLLVALAPLAVHAADAGKRAPAPAYFRYDEDGGNGGSGDFELLVRRFKNPKTGAVVTLAGMVHFAEPAFYAKINALAKQHDAVLLEGVRGGVTLTSLPILYRMSLVNRLIGPMRLEGQNDQLERTGPRYRNADVEMKDLDTGSTALRDHLKLPLLAVMGESIYTLSGIAEQGMWLTGNGDTYAHGARELLAEELVKPEKKTEAERDRLIIVNRNAAVLKALDEELAKPGGRRVFIPWGAGHQQGLEEGLLARGFVAENDEWLRAFSVKHMDTSPETASGFRWQLPYVACIRTSDTTADLSGPFGLLSYKDSPHVYSHSSVWGLLHKRLEEKGESSFSLLSGIVWTDKNNAADHTGSSYALLGLWGGEHTPARDNTRLGWWGFLGGAATTTDDKGAGTSSEWHLPLAFGANHPLLYGRTTDTKTGKVTHRFLGFFQAESD